MTTPEPSPLLSAKELDSLDRHADAWAEAIRAGLSDNAQITVGMIKRLIAQARAARPSPWQPMETAPKDGTEIIGFRDGAMVLIWYCGPAHSAGKFEWSYSDAPAYFEPTHWMPLPSPPAPPAQDGGRA